MLFTANDYVQATREHRRMMVEMEPLYERFDAFVTAGMGEAPRLADYRSVSFWQKPSLLTAWNVTGQPVLALPNGFGRNGLPLGMQILGRPFGETTILRVGHAYEQATEWHAGAPRSCAGAEAPAVTPPPVLSVTADQADAATRDLCATAARRAGLRLDDLMLAQLLEGAPYALGMVERLRRDHGLHHEPANIFSFPPSQQSLSAARCWPSCGRAMPPARSPASTTQIRRLWGVPYVSSLQRHLATRPGWLEWTWAALGPAFTSGVAQAAAWRAADGLAVPRLAPLSRDALAVWGVDAAGEAAIRATCASFVRVSPVNLVLSGLLRRLLTGERPPGANGGAPAWTPPRAAGPAAGSRRSRRAAARPARGAGHARHHRGRPGLRARALPDARVVAGLPRPRGDGAAAAPRRRGHARGRPAAPGRGGRRDPRACSPPCRRCPPRPAMPPAAEFAEVLAALDTYRKTSPEMVVFGRMLGDALPRP